VLAQRPEANGKNQMSQEFFNSIKQGKLDEVQRLL